MGIESLGDIVDTPVSQVLTWATSGDWDAAVSESGVEHGSIVGANGEIRLGTDEDDGDAAEWTNLSNGGNLSTQDTTTYVGPYARRIDDNNQSNTYFSMDYTFSSRAINDIIYWLNIPNNNTNNWIYSPRGYDGSTLITLLGFSSAYSAGEMAIRDASSWEVIPYTYPDNSWFRVRQVNDYANDQYSVYTMEPGSSEVERYTNASFHEGNSGSAIDKIGENWMYDTDGTETGYHDHYYNFHIDAGSLTTATKSFSNAVAPDLTDLDYTLVGESITLDVIGSPGTASEETVSQTLDGASSYSLTWSNSHTDFRVTANLSTADPSTTPTYRAVSLQG
jgi:hypothetical protein